MPYKSKAELAREDWMTVPEAVAQIRSAEKCEEEDARHQLRKALADGASVLGVLKWDDDQAPPFGYSPVAVPTDTPPLGRAWLTAKIRWKTGKVRNDWGEYEHGKWRTLLIRRFAVRRRWSGLPG
jgi:hypothetical protein